MALLEMNDHVDGIEALRAFNAGGVPTQYPLGVNGLGFSIDPNVKATMCEQLLNDPNVTTKQYRDAGCTDSSFSERGSNIMSPAAPRGGAPSAGGPGGSGAPTGSQSTIQSIVDAIKQLAPTLAPLAQKRPKVKNVIQKEPDYTTYAVIGGAVIVASVLAIAIGKSGARRRRD